MALGGAGLALLLVEAVLILPRGWRLRRRLLELRQVQRAELGAIRSELRLLRRLRAEMAVAARPHRFAWRVYHHPLSVALMASRRRRREARHKVMPPPTGSTGGPAAGTG